MFHVLVRFATGAVAIAMGTIIGVDARSSLSPPLVVGALAASGAFVGVLQQTLP